MDKDFTPKCEGPGVASLDHGPGNDPCAGTKIGKALKVDVVENPGPIQRKSPIAHRSQLFAVAMVRPQTRRQADDVVPCGRRNQNLDPNEISSPAGAAIFLYALANRHGISNLISM